MTRTPELVITLDRTSPPPLHRQVYEKIRQQIVTGLLKSGDAIPPSRLLAEQLEVSRTVVVQAYEQLECEGFLECIRGSGTFVSDQAPSVPLQESVKALKQSVRSAEFEISDLLTLKRSTPPPNRREDVRYDFRHGAPAWDHLPMTAWRRLHSRVCASALPDTLGYGPAEGSLELRTEIARMLRHSRGIATTENELIIATGATQALDMVSRVLLSENDIVLVEDPTHPVLRDIFRFAGANIIPIPVDNDGLCVNKIDNILSENGIAATTTKNKLIYVTPSHQFPSGVTMSSRRKVELLNWAYQNNAVIVEDDYDSDYRFDGPRISALAGLDTADRVIYIGTFSKVLFPALRIGYMRVPQSLLQPVVSVKWLADRLTPTLEQEILAMFMSSGQYTTHVRRMTRLYAERRTALVEGLTKCFGSRVTIVGSQAGLHVLVGLASTASEAEIVQSAESMGVRIYPASPYYLRNMPTRPQFLMGYGSLSEKQIREGIHLLHQAEKALV